MKKRNLNRFRVPLPFLGSWIGFEWKKIQTDLLLTISNNLYLKVFVGWAQTKSLMKRFNRDWMNFKFYFRQRIWISKLTQLMIVRSMPWLIDINGLIWRSARSCESTKYIVTKENINPNLSKFWISIFTVRRIIKQFESNTKREEIHSWIRWNKLIRSPKVWAIISKYVMSNSWSFTSSDIQKYILKEWSVLIPNHQIRKHLKCCERLSYNKGSSRSYSLDVNKQKLKKAVVLSSTGAKATKYKNANKFGWEHYK